MRLDLFLKLSRLIKRRTVANAFCSGGNAWLNGKPAKPSTEIHEGDELLLSFGSARQLTVRIIAIPLSKRVPVDMADSLYTVLSTTADVEEALPPL